MGGSILPECRRSDTYLPALNNNTPEFLDAANGSPLHQHVGKAAKNALAPLPPLVRR
jgi:hypothetical protein